MINENVEYNSVEDILYIYGKQEPTPVKGSLILDNLSFDISPSGELVGMQIDNASKFFSVPPKILEESSKAKIEIITRGQTIIIGWAINLGNTISRNQFVFPKNKIALNCNG